MNTLNKARLTEPLSYEQSEPVHSENFHKEVIYNLERELFKEPKAVGALCDWIASHHELALIYQHKGAIESAQKCLLIPHQTMLYMAQNHYGDEEKKLIALKAISLTLPPLIEFSKRYPPCQDCMKNLNLQLNLIEKDFKDYH